MAIACRVDGIRKIGNSIHITVTQGQTPIAASASGEGRVYGSLQDLAAMVTEYQERLVSGDGLLMLLLAIWRKVDPGGTNPSAIIGRTITMDVTPPTITISVTGPA